MEGDEKSSVHVGSLVEVEWPFDDGSSRKCMGHVCEVRCSRTTKAGCSKKFRIRFDDGRELWSRLNGSFSLLSTSGDASVPARPHGPLLELLSSLGLVDLVLTELAQPQALQFSLMSHTMLLVHIHKAAELSTQQQKWTADCDRFHLPCGLFHLAHGLQGALCLWCAETTVQRAARWATLQVTLGVAPAVLG